MREIEGWRQSGTDVCDGVWMALSASRYTRAEHNGLQSGHVESLQMVLDCNNIIYSLPCELVYYIYTHEVALGEIWGVQTGGIGQRMGGQGVNETICGDERSAPAPPVRATVREGTVGWVQRDMLTSEDSELELCRLFLWWPGLSSEPLLSLSLLRRPINTHTEHLDILCLLLDSELVCWRGIPGSFPSLVSFHLRPR